MANKTLFASIKSKLLRTDSTNEAGGRAYKFARSMRWRSWRPRAASTARTMLRPKRNWTSCAS